MEEAELKSFKESGKIRVGIPHGDLNGVGYEIIIKCFLDSRIYDQILPIVYGSSKVASYHRKTIGQGDFNFNLIKNASLANSNRANIVNITLKEIKIELGKSTEIAGEMAFLALEQAVQDIKDEFIDVIVTAPINKKNIQSAAFDFPGHTEYFARKFEASDHLMIMISNGLRIGVVTGHIPLKNVSETLTVDLIMKKISVLNDSLLRDFAIEKPRIALLGLNPHAGDGGLLGKEEEEIIHPAIKMASEQGMLVYGPYPADGFFASDQMKKFDGILAMYHDQGLIPFKALAFDKGVNFTAGLPYIRTSPAHGTAYDIAGKDLASPTSFMEALTLAKEIYNNRKTYNNLKSDPLKDYLGEMENSRRPAPPPSPPRGEEKEEPSN